jgi:Sec-independent protein secretion pathway component TatC
MLAIPIIVLYEISIYMAKIVERNRPKDEYDDLDDDLDDDDEDEGGEVKPA